MAPNLSASMQLQHELYNDPEALFQRAVQCATSAETCAQRDDSHEAQGWAATSDAFSRAAAIRVMLDDRRTDVDPEDFIPPSKDDRSDPYNIGVERPLLDTAYGIITYLMKDRRRRTDAGALDISRQALNECMGLRVAIMHNEDGSVTVTV